MRSFMHKVSASARVVQIPRSNRSRLDTSYCRYFDTSIVHASKLCNLVVLPFGRHRNGFGRSARYMPKQPKKCAKTEVCP
jgi:hypothetical protein